MESNKPSLLILSGTGFLRAYAGTLYLARSLQSLGYPVTVVVPATEAEVPEYGRLDIPVVCVLVPSGGRMRRRWQGLLLRARMFRHVFRADRVIVTENRFFPEAVVAKFLRRTGMVLGHYCQELVLKADYPDVPRIGLIERWADSPDFVIDVEPNRARLRKERLGLRKEPLVLRNTLPRSAIPARRDAGGLELLAGVRIPPEKPVLLHMGGVGREKPLERVIDAIAGCSDRVFFLAFCNAPEAQIAALAAYAGSRLPADACAILGPRRREELLASAWEADLGIIDYTTAVEDTANQRFCAPTKLYEFMALGLAVVGSNNDSLREVVEGERIGLCAAGGSSEELGAVVKRVVDDPAELREMGARAERAFQARHCYERLCMPVIEAIGRCLDDEAGR